MSTLWSIEPEWLFDGIADGVRTDCSVVLSGQTIQEVSSRECLDRSAIERCVRLPGVTLMPGLIDAHVHLTLCGCATPRRTVMRESDEFLLLRASSAAREALHNGITTVRDCGDRDGITFHLREAARKEITEAPRLLLAGPPLTSPRGHCYFLGGEVEGCEQIRETIEELAATGADFIKVMATGGGMTPGTDSLALQFSADELGCIVEASARQGLSVAAHAHSPEAIAACVEAGVKTIEHASFATPDGVIADLDLTRRMAQRNVTVVPTNVPARNAVRAGRTLGLATQIGVTSEAFIAARQEVVRALFDSGVRVIAGTDGGATGVRITDLAGEIQILCEAGLGPVQALRSATSDSAAALGLEKLGRIAPGFEADLLGVKGNPLLDIAALAKPVFVVQSGRIVREEYQ